MYVQWDFEINITMVGTRYTKKKLIKLFLSNELNTLFLSCLLSNCADNTRLLKFFS